MRSKTRIYAVCYGPKEDIDGTFLYFLEDVLAKYLGSSKRKNWMPFHSKKISIGFRLRLAEIWWKKGIFEK